MRRLSIFPPTTHHFPFQNHNTILFSISSFPKKNPRSNWARMSSITARNKKIIVIMGPTGCGKSKLSVDLATRFFPSSEIINSDKIQVYNGLDITTNKIPFLQRRNVPHHLIGEFDSSESHPEFTSSDFRSSGSYIISEIINRNRIPFIVGGSNSFIYALLAKKFNPDLDVFSGSGNSVFCNELRFKCCFIWVDVSSPVLNQYLVKRVDDMLESGMYNELAEYFSNLDSDPVSQSGLKKAIGVAEFDRYFKRFNKIKNSKTFIDDDVELRELYEEAVKEIKDNTCQLAKRQLGKILRLRDEAGWELKRVDATAAVKAVVGGEEVAEIWEKQMVEPSVKIVKRFLMK